MSQVILPQTQKWMVERLDRTVFTSAGFEVTFHEDGNTLFKAVFRQQPEFAFLIHPSANAWKTKESPSNHLNVAQQYDCRDFQLCLGRFESWANRLQATVLANLDQEEPIPLLDSFMQWVESIPRDKEDPFTHEQAESLFERVRSVAEQYRQALHKADAKLQKLSDELKTNYDKRFKEFEERIAELERQGSQLPKKTILRALWSRLSGLGKFTATTASKAGIEQETREALKDASIQEYASNLLEVGKKLLE